MSDELAVRRAVLEAARAHRPIMIEAYEFDCSQGNCEHEGECPLSELRVCAACHTLGEVIDQDSIYAEVYAENCPICYVWMTAEEG